MVKEGKYSHSHNVLLNVRIKNFCPHLPLWFKANNQNSKPDIRENEHKMNEKGFPKVGECRVSKTLCPIHFQNLKWTPQSIVILPNLKNLKSAIDTFLFKTSIFHFFVNILKIQHNKIQFFLH